jgi:hypothetical protein
LDNSRNSSLPLKRIFASVGQTKSLILLICCGTYGITLDDAALRWAAAEGVPETVIAAICLLDENRSVDEIVARLTPVELEQVIKIVGRSPRGYRPAAYEALKEERHRRN